MLPMKDITPDMMAKLATIESFQEKKDFCFNNGFHISTYYRRLRRAEREKAKLLTKANKEKVKEERRARMAHARDSRFRGRGKAGKVPAGEEVSSDTLLAENAAPGNKKSAEQKEISRLLRLAEAWKTIATEGKG